MDGEAAGSAPRDDAMTRRSMLKTALAGVAIAALSAAPTLATEATPRDGSDDADDTGGGRKRHRSHKKTAKKSSKKKGSSKKAAKKKSSR